MPRYHDVSVLGWGWNSNQLSPTTTKDFKKLVVIKVAVGDEKNENKLSKK